MRNQRGFWVWQFPQGGIDKDESPKKAAYRELFEETGIKKSHVELLGETQDWLYYDLPKDRQKRWRGQRQKWFAMRFSGSDDLISIETETPEFSHWAWMPHSELVHKIVPFKKHTYAKVFDAFGAHLEA